MKVNKSILLSIVLLVMQLTLFKAQATATIYPLADEGQKTRFHHLLKELRCLVCQNQDLADSNASLANDLRQQVYTMIKQGKTDSDIRTYLTARYGDFILFEPPVKAVTFLLWFGPALFLVIGFLVFWRMCFKAKSS